ncbi:DUF4236 domain-containing protein [Marinobacter sp. M3C]|uniref:DUF4236 domain-containing protein n=1 Tax=Marinobacter sp. M3C TaxID=2917715 RepID=UPI00200CEC43|nr:DUF4236 domain-containing protein [Marinobacter sp. M3C]UQG61521.1 DUF4236 domain-containing protein [Marinobacter sp. M3C]
MAFRFRRTVSIFPGVRINLGKRGVSVSAGVRGANVTLGRNGLYGNVGIPGSGMSYRKRLLKLNKAGDEARSTGSAAPSLAAPAEAEEIAHIQLNTKKGDIAILDADGNHLGDAALEVAKTHARQHLEDTLQQQVNIHNRIMATISSIHWDTPAPDHFPTLVAEPFDAPEPEAPALRTLDWLAYLCPARRRAFAGSNERKGQLYQNQHEQWTQEKLALEQREFARATERGIGVSVKELSDTASRKLYMAHVHGMGIRLVGECFACAPSVEEVILSAFTQVVRADTGQTEDRYIYSVKVHRNAWARIHFGNLQAVDPVAALAAFELRRDMTKTGIFTAIKPW